ncbi:Rosmarinate synthase [Acorus calamus]|uniref:Rosmarinate synthase n=1 Tax=Acorus calamus TaxID=4465 RepID=A0AAV9DJP3_ACOCL|nr:Rosmarinate synthase [Acorus calamus]
MDLVMKLHYLQGVYHFREGDLPTERLRDTMFPFLSTFTPAAGRIRRSMMGRPHIKCNDSGFTRFKCGGLAVGLRWPHVLGDAFSAASFINMWGQLLSGKILPLKPQHLLQPITKLEKPKKASLNSEKPFSIKQVPPVEDCWIVANENKMETFSFQFTGTKLKHLLSNVSGGSEAYQYSPFEVISAVIWQCLAKVRGGKGPEMITICKTDTSSKRDRILSNHQTLSTIKADFSVAEAKLSMLAELISGELVNESEDVEGHVDDGSGTPDFIVFGTNLTFVDMEGIDFYKMEINGQKPVAINYNINGVGDGGVVLVLHDAEGALEARGDSSGRIVTVTLPIEQALHLRNELESEWGIA